MNAASCSVNSNPLAQFNKHTQENNSHMQQGNMTRMGSSASLQSHDQFKTTVNTMSEKSKLQMNHFMNGSNSNMYNLPSPSSSASLQLGGHLSPKQTSWSSNHVPTLKSMREHHASAQMASPSSTSLSGMRHEWSQEFQHNNQSNVSMSSSIHGQQQYQNGNMSPMHFQPLHSVPSNYNIYGGNSSNPSFMRPLQRQPSNRDVAMINSQSNTTNWDQQFNDLEKEVSEALNINDDDIIEEVETNEGKNQSLESQGDIVIDNDYQAEFQQVWDSIHQDSEDIMPNYLNGQRFFDQRTELGNIKYDFEDSKNEYLNNPNAYEIGCILMENGAKLSEAAMAFEAAVKENPKHVDAWLKLGLVQIQNEKEINGISALENCLKLDPKNLEAMKNLAISYINEGYDSSSFTILNKWIETKYPQIDTSVPDNDHHLAENEMEDPLTLNEKITKRFLRLANQLPEVDPDVQLCLGLLFYANDDFNKTIDCFKAALKVNPNDELMWNRLGAALANSNRSEESIKAYHRALQLKPSFVRARYNLAVSSMNIGCYKEAVEHLLTSLRMHEVEGMKQMEKNNHSYDNYNNDNIIETLKRAFIAMDRTDLLEKVYPGMDLNQFRNEFKF